MINLVNQEGKPTATFSRPQGWAQGLAGDTSSFGYGSLGNGKGSEPFSIHQPAQFGGALAAPAPGVNTEATGALVGGMKDTTSKPNTTDLRRLAA